MSIGLGCFAARLPSVDDAIALLCRRIAPIDGAETVPLAQAAGRILAQDVEALTAMPPWDRSAMDGYAFAFGKGRRLRLVGRSLPGRPFSRCVEEGECVAIATGAPLPAGCDSVAMQEHCEIFGGDILIGGAGLGRHVRKRGEDFQPGDRLTAAGVKLEAHHLALLASARVSSVSARPRLRVAVFSIGDELLQEGGIPDANRIMVLAQCAALGAQTSDLGILPDDRSRVAQVMGAAAATHDMVICSAGTSVGEEDHARGAVLDCGGEMLLAGVAIKPGRPVSFARIGSCLQVALPGNPAAAFVTMAVLAIPLLRHKSGETTAARPWPGIRAAFSYRKKAGHREYLRVALRQDNGLWVADKGAPINSAALAGLAQSDALVCLEEGLTDITPGMTLPYCLFSQLAGA